jgi:hypothetical protein
MWTNPGNIYSKSLTDTWMWKFPEMEYINGIFPCSAMIPDEPIQYDNFYHRDSLSISCFHSSLCSDLIPLLACCNINDICGLIFELAVPPRLCRKTPALTPFSSGAYEVDTIEQLKKAVRSQVKTVDCRLVFSRFRQIGIWIRIPSRRPGPGSWYSIFIRVYQWSGSRKLVGLLGPDTDLDSFFWKDLLWILIYGLERCWSNTSLFRSRSLELSSKAL